jgi:hypothetical protein
MTTPIKPLVLWLYQTSYYDDLEAQQTKRLENASQLPTTHSLHYMGLTCPTLYKFSWAIDILSKLLVSLGIQGTPYYFLYHFFYWQSIELSRAFNPNRFIDALSKHKLKVVNPHRDG